MCEQVIFFIEIIDTFSLVSGHKTITNDSKNANKRSTDRLIAKDKIPLQ